MTLKYSLASLIVSMALLAICTVIPKHSLEIAAAFATTTTLILLIVATIVATFPRGRHVGWARGFSIAGWAYFLLIMMGNLRHSFLANDMIDWLAFQLGKTEIVHGPAGEPMPPMMALQHFIDMGHAFFAIWFGTIAGLFSHWIYSRRKDLR